MHSGLSFPDELKLKEIIPTYKKILDKEKYNLVSLFSHISKLFEKTTGKITGTMNITTYG